MGPGGKYSKKKQYMVIGGNRQNVEIDNTTIMKKSCQYDYEERTNSNEYIELKKESLREDDWSGKDKSCNKY